MNFLLDAKDLIDAVEHDLPIRLADFEAHLRRRSDRIALTTTNVREFVAPLMGDNDFLRMRRLVQQLEDLPICYLREGTIIEAELAAARRAYEKAPKPFASTHMFPVGMQHSSHLKPLRALLLDFVLMRSSIHYGADGERLS
jgi:hypothetical protein